MAVLRNGKQLPYGSAGSATAYAKPLFSQEQMEQLNLLVGSALVEPVIWRRMTQHDESLCEEFALDESIWDFITSTAFSSLEELCQSVVAFSHESLLM